MCSEIDLEYNIGNTKNCYSIQNLDIDLEDRKKVSYDELLKEIVKKYCTNEIICSINYDSQIKPYLEKCVQGTEFLA